jgi:uncharacterized protein
MIFVLLALLGLGMIIEAVVELAPVGLLPSDLMLRVLAGLLFGFLIGAISSVLGVAGGEVILPTLVFAYGVPVKAAGSLSMFISLPTVLTGSVGSLCRLQATDNAYPANGSGFGGRCGCRWCARGSGLCRNHQDCSWSAADMVGVENLRALN